MRLVRTVTAALGLALLLAAASEGAGDRPALRIVATDPLTLAGRSFRAGEVVKVIVEPQLRAPRTAKARATAAGAFRLAFAGVTVDRCSGDLDVTAVGSKGSRVSFSLRRLLCGGRLDD